MHLGIGLHINRRRRTGASAPPVYVAPYDDTIADGWSTRLLRSGYVGPCLRVRRSSDNAEADIGFGSDGNLDLVALAAHVGGGSGYVVTWYDQSVTPRNATNATANAQPLIVAAGTPAGDPALQFFADANFDCLTTVSALAVADYTINAVASWDGTASSQWIISNSRAGIPAMGFTTGGAIGAGGGETIAASVAGGVGWRHASMTAVAATGARGIIAESSAEATGTSVAWTVLDQNRIGASRATGNNPMRGRIAEIVILPGIKIESERRAAIANSTAWFGA